MPTIEAIRKALAEVMDPELHRNIVELGMVHDLEFSDGVVRFALALTTMACPLRGRMEDEARARLLALPGVRQVEVAMREMTAAEKEAIFGQPQQEGGSATPYNHIAHVIAVLSGKGGVGKSTVSALLAVTLRRQGLKVGILDADITGPSIPKMLLTNHDHPSGSPMGIVPIETASGIKVMSINLLLADPNQAVIWRGPLISGAIKQFYNDVYWGDLDYLIVDLPPGTSDASLTVLQSIPLNGIVMVTTPQSLAGMVVRKASAMARQLGIPLLGVIENMAYLECPDCGKQIALFGESNVAELTASVGAPLLGRLPLQPEIAPLADSGRLDDYAGDGFEAIVERLLALTPEVACGPAAR